MTTPNPAPLPPSAAAFQDPATAIAFALDCLENFEVGPFLTDRRAGQDLESWLQHVVSIREEVAQYYTQHSGSSNAAGTGFTISRLL